MKKALYTLLILAGAVFAVHVYAAPAAAAKSDYSGTWKMNVAKSDFGQIPPPVSETQVITQTADSIKIVRTSARDEGEMTYTLALKLDGTEIPIPAGTFPEEAPFKIVSSKADWDGANLIITQKTSYQGNPGTLKSRHSLSPDGKVLTESSEIASDMGSFTITSVYDKQ